jgi:hypothetical protein
VGWFFGLVAGAALLAGLAWGGDFSTCAPTSGAGATTEEVAAYWTAERLQAAWPLDLVLGSGLPAAGGGVSPSPAASDATATKCPASSYTYEYDDDPRSFPQRTVGRLYVETANGPGYCTAVLVGENVILTAGHCVSAGIGGCFSKFLFIPSYINGQEPYGRWPATMAHTFTAWLTKGDVARDVAFLKLASQNGQNLGNLVGYLGLASDKDATAQTWVQLGYPMKSPFDGQRLVAVTSGFGQFDPTGTLTPAPVGVGSNMTEGASGGPWLIFLEGTPYVNGLNAYGYPTCAETIYSPYFDSLVRDLFRSVR